MILNETYYQALWKKFEDVKHLTTNFVNNVVKLSVKMILKHYQENKPLHINFQNSKNAIPVISRHLFVELTIDIFINYYDLPILLKGSRLMDLRKYSDGKRHDYFIKSISNDSYVLEHTKNKAQLSLKYDDLVKKFIPIEKGTKQSALQDYTNFFSDLNVSLNLGFTPTNFSKKIVFIAKKSLWDSLPLKNEIPSIYLPNPRDEKNASEIRSIPALNDCLAYFTPRYEVCYHSLFDLLESKKIKTIIVIDTESDKIQQIIQDKARFGFNLIIISNNLSPVKNEKIPCWNWFREELKIVNSI